MSSANGSPRRLSDEYIKRHMNRRRSSFMSISGYEPTPLSSGRRGSIVAGMGQARRSSDPTVKVLLNEQSKEAMLFHRQKDLKVDIPDYPLGPVNSAGSSED